MTVPPRRRYVVLLVALHLWLGVAWLLSGPSRSSGPAFRVLRQVGGPVWPSRPMWVWAFLFLAAGLLMLVAVLRQRRQVWALLVGLVVIGVYGTVQSLAGFTDSHATITPIGVWGVYLGWHVVTIRHFRALGVG